VINTRNVSVCLLDGPFLPRPHHTAAAVRTGPPFRGSAIPGVRVRVRVRVKVKVRVNPSGPPEWRTGIAAVTLYSNISYTALDDFFNVL